ncbi:MAG: cation-translocating P-type ATPase [Anaerolineae bacterium]|nr:cation-translocating P-type ATPase [Anaerolineae bacterium]
MRVEPGTRPALAVEQRSWHEMPVAEVIQGLHTDGEQGLPSAEAAARLARYGPNALREAPAPSFLQLLWGQFTNFLVLILIAASVLSLALGDTIEAVAIMAIVLLNAVIGVVQESRAEGALRALRKLAAPQADVVRDGQPQSLPTESLVPGDLVLLQTGNRVPADVRLVETYNLRVEEASLTGESHPVGKRAEGRVDGNAPLGDRVNLAFMGTTVTYGRGKGVVVATGMHTQIGLIATMLESYSSEPTPLQRKLDQLGRILGWLALAVCGVVFLAGVLRGKEWLEMLITAVSLAIAAVPEGLAAVVTICLALGMQRMVRRHALLRRLPAVETLGSATFICSDKTGTLTQNAMMVTRIYVDGETIEVTGRAYDPWGELWRGGELVDPAEEPGLEQLLRIGACCNDARLVRSGEEEGRSLWRMLGDPTEGALLAAAAKGKLDLEALPAERPRVAEVPFTAERKRMMTVHRLPDGRLEAYVKGAPEGVLEHSDRLLERGTIRPLTAADRERILAENQRMAEGALRVLGMAYRELERLPDELDETHEEGLVFVGLAGMIDPARSEVAPAVAVAKQAGIRTVMITGDYPQTAAAVAREIGLLDGGVVLTGSDLDRMDEEQLVAAAPDTVVYARTSPQHKLRIVEALKRLGHIVAMTGDGVNDAPALKRADIGVAMGITGTDVAKETADMILTDDNYASIVSAVEEGRTIYANIRKFVYYLLSCNVGEIMVVFLATLLNWPLPLTAIQLLTLNLVTDGAPALALGLEKAEPGVMTRPPRPPQEPVIDRVMVRGILLQTLAMTAATLGAFRLGWLRHAGAPEALRLTIAQTMAFVTLSVSELLRAYTARSEHHSVFSLGPFTNRTMQWAVLSSFGIILAVIYVPFLDPVFNTAFLGPSDWAVMLPLILLPATIAEVAKLLPRGLWLRRARAASAAGGGPAR